MLMLQGRSGQRVFKEKTENMKSKSAMGAWFAGRKWSLHRWTRMDPFGVSPWGSLVKSLFDLGIHGLGFVIVAIGKKLVVVLVGVVETVPASSTRIVPEGCPNNPR
ncbi:hypothetical protein Tco_0627832 [Tanacetum coccineum]|uniref:Uncharacterized protein n=1 Tax=Tanacetum coccineum TaxID=301880 RepID=A0ABQ4WNN0_9ASTR